jgi:hypothetical protein
MSRLGKLADLEVLVLHGTDLTDAGLAGLSALKKLRRLELSEPKLTEAGITRLKGALPGLEIVR